jgi:hypothetical protein
MRRSFVVSVTAPRRLDGAQPAGTASGRAMKDEVNAPRGRARAPIRRADGGTG